MQEMVQLVLQFSPWASGDLDQLVALEDELIATLPEEASIDGHDMGSNEANIFIHTRDPQRTLLECVQVVGRLGLLSLFSAGHRPLSGNRYARAWPRGDESSFSVK
jgi:hypothetical protein